MVPPRKDEAPSEHDRRSAPRYPAHFNLEAVFGFGAPTPMLATSVSQGGIFLRSDDLPKLGDKVSIRIDLPYATVKLAGTVRRLVPAPGAEAGFAVQIDRFDEGEEAWSSLVRTARMRTPK